jgi:collagenase-like PrtC family protease
MSGDIQLTVGPLLFHWSPEAIADLYGRLAAEPAVGRVHLGEVVCGKRLPLTRDVLRRAADVLREAGKEVVWSGPALPMSARDLAVAHDQRDGGLVEINDLSGLACRRGDAPFVAGPFLNVYNEDAAAELIARGCTRLCANVELSLSALSAIASAHPALEIELFAFGRLPLALSGRCHHAHLHGLTKDACRFVCNRDPDGLAVDTLEGQAFLAINGVQTLSHGVQLADVEPNRLRAAGVTALRISPQTCDSAAVARAFRRFLDGDFSRTQLRSAVADAVPPGRLVNGYLHGAPGHLWRPGA